MTNLLTLVPILLIGFLCLLFVFFMSVSYIGERGAMQIKDYEDYDH